MTVTSIFQEDVNPTLAGQPFAYFFIRNLMSNSSLTEYYADCSVNGNPILLLMDLEITTRNLKHGSALSVCIETTPPKGVYSVASLPRMNLNGQMVKLEDSEDVHLPFTSTPNPTLV